MKKWFKWGLWFAIAISIFFLGWGINQAVSKGIGGAIMLLGILLTGFLLIYAAIKNLKQ